jgi:hypothetical protein
MKSRKKTPAIGLVLGLISPKRCEDLLYELVNLQEETSACWRLFRRFPEVFAVFQADEMLVRAIEYRNRLRHAWEAPNARRRDWYLYEIRHAFQTRLKALQMGIDLNQALIDAVKGDQEGMEKVRSVSDPGLTESPLEAALYYLQTRAASRIRICPNPDCSAKYFLKSPSNPKQTACSPECADWVRRASKRRWWTENRGASADEIYKGEGKKGVA